MTTIRLRLLSQRKNVSSDYSVLKARPSIARQNRESWKTASVAKRNPAVVAYDSKSWIAEKILDRSTEMCYADSVKSVGVDDGKPHAVMENTIAAHTIADKTFFFIRNPPVIG